MEHLNENIRNTYDRIVRDWVRQGSICKELMKLYPLEIADKTINQDAYIILAQYGSPAMTDGKKVFFAPDIMEKLLKENKFYEYNRCDFTWDNTLSFQEDNWKVGYDKNLEANIMRELYREIKGILLHEYTHAFEEHSKIAYQYKDKPEQFQTKLQVAFEIQANDGIFGNCPWEDLTQQLKGVTNKRLHPETLGAHTLKDIMDKLKLNDNEKQGGGNSSRQQEGREKLAKQTGASEALKECGNGYSLERSVNTETILQELFGDNLKSVKNIVAEALSSDLKYDVNADRIIKAPIKKKVKEASYSRPSKKYTEGGIIKKGIKKYKIKEPEKVNKLLVIAVDCSGSMDGVSKYVASITDKLLKDVKDVAQAYNLEVDYDRVLGCRFSDWCERPVPINSTEWRNRMTNMCVGGGTHFTSVIEEVRKINQQKHYDEITVLCVGDGQGIINARELPLAYGDSHKPIANTNDFKWVDALIASKVCDGNDYYQSCVSGDFYKDIRSSVIIANVVE